jgi:putative spermidine/putrescine transport system substrate-binding protein
LIAAFAAALLSAQTAQAAESLTVVSWGGAYTRSQVEAYMKPYTAKTGVVFNVIDYNGGLDQVERQVESGMIEWDIVDVELSDAIRGCDIGLFEEIPHDILPPGDDGMPIEDDFFPTTLQDSRRSRAPSRISSTSRSSPANAVLGSRRGSISNGR